MIIGVCGLIGSGKGTVADILVNTHKFTKISFADKLKDGVASIYGWNREMLEGATKESREWREQEDSFWTKELGRSITPRNVLQVFGTECMREGFDDSIWVALVKQELQKDPLKKWVIPDVRFPNELKMIQQLNGKMWEVSLGDNPNWYSIAEKDNKSQWKSSPNSVVTHVMEDSYPDIHASEYKWIGWDFDATIQNDGIHLQLLTRQVVDLLEPIQSY